MKISWLSFYMMGNVGCVWVKKVICLYFLHKISFPIAPSSLTDPAIINTVITEFQQSQLLKYTFTIKYLPALLTTLWSTTLRTSSTNDSVIWSIVVIIEHFTNEIRIYNMNLHHHWGTEFLTLFSKKLLSRYLTGPL